VSPVPLAQLDLSPAQRLLWHRLEEGPLPFAELVVFVRAADRLADEHSLPVRIDQALWPLLDAGVVAFERHEIPVERWADVIPTAQLLTRPDPGARWRPAPAAPADLVLVALAD
jgi:hypothetical protein